jgi:hypothetical protein
MKTSRPLFFKPLKQDRMFHPKSSSFLVMACLLVQGVGLLYIAIFLLVKADLGLAPD